jgi:hypothetical protein
MEWYCRWMRTRTCDQLTLLEVHECILDSASGESCTGGHCLMGNPDGPVHLLVGCVTIKVKVYDERGRAAVMAYQIGQEAIEQIGIKGYFCHKGL